MNATTLLRPAQRVLTAAALVTVALTGVVSGSPAASAAPSLASQATTVHHVGSATDLLGLQPVTATPALPVRTYEQKVLHRLNVVRARHHLRPVTPAACAETVATRWATHLAATDEFQHQSMQKLLKTCHARYVGETLARGAVSPRTIVSMWMHSPPHRHILMSRSPRHVGIGATPNARGEWVVAANWMTF